MRETIHNLIQALLKLYLGEDEYEARYCQCDDHRYWRGELTDEDMFGYRDND